MASVEVQAEERPFFDRRPLHGPFDLIGDVHGCARELDLLLARLGYGAECDSAWTHPEGRMAVFLGDVVDRGPGIVRAMQRVTSMTAAGSALFVPGNHDERFVGFLMGGEPPADYGIEDTLDQLEALDDSTRSELLEAFLRMYMEAPPYLWLDEGRLAAVHGGIEEEMLGRFDREVWQYCLMGKLVEDANWPTLIRRADWARDYRGATLIAYGHTPCPSATLVNNTVNLDQGCVFGGQLSALRYPERELINVPAARPYFVPSMAAAP